MKRQITKWTTFAAALVMAGTAQAAVVSFTEDFSGLALPANMSDPNAPGSTDFSGADATFNNPRHFVVTTEKGYDTMSTIRFVAEGTVTLVSSGTSADGDSFFGLGPGTNGGAFGTPDDPTVYAEIAPQSFANGFVRFHDDPLVGGSTDSGTLGQGNGGWGNGSVHRVRLTWTSATQSAFFELDQNYTGVFATDFNYTIDGSDNGFDGTNAGIFFGAGLGTSWDDISVSVLSVPEPNTLALLAIGALALRLRKRG